MLKTIKQIGISLICLTFFSQISYAAEEVLTFSSPKYEQRYDSMIKELRCLVCQNQNIADSNAELAKDLKNKTYELIESGQSDSEIKTFMRDRYGDFVLYEPPMSGNTLLLWFGPILVLAIAGFIALRFIRRQNQLNTEAD